MIPRAERQPRGFPRADDDGGALHWPTWSYSSFVGFDGRKHLVRQWFGKSATGIALVHGRLGMT